MTLHPPGHKHAARPVPPQGSAPAQETVAERPYDLVKEFVIALVVVSVITVTCAVIFSSPDERPITLQSWARARPADFVATAVTELDGTSATATYGAPYTHADAGQTLGPLALQRWAGVRIPVDTARKFVLAPLQRMSADPSLRAALVTYERAPAGQQHRWTVAYADAVSAAPADASVASRPAYGPVALMMRRLLQLARSGGLDGALLNQKTFYQTDYTGALLFLSDGSYLESQARAQHLGGDQWGMMNETGNYPGQAWLWLYTFWYQINPFKSSDNADALIWGLMALLTLLLLLVPFIPGLRSVPRLIPVYRLIWRDHYRAARPGETAPPSRARSTDRQ
jgi:hypothetical protein